MHREPRHRLHPASECLHRAGDSRLIACKATAQANTSLLLESFRSALRVSAISTTVSACTARSSSRGVPPAFRTILHQRKEPQAHPPRCFRVTVCDRRSSASSRSDSRVSCRASSIPLSHAARELVGRLSSRDKPIGGDQVSGEIPAIDGRDIFRLQWHAACACRTNCKNVRGIARDPSSFRASPPTGPRHRAFRASRKSRAAITDKRYRPMFVGDVRWAMMGFGSS